MAFLFGLWRVEEVEDGFVEGGGVVGGFVVGAAREDEELGFWDMGGDLAGMFVFDDVVLAGHDEDGAADGLELIEGMAGFGKEEGDEAVAVGAGGELVVFEFVLFFMEDGVDGVVDDGVVDEDVGAHGGEAADLAGVGHGHDEAGVPAIAPAEDVDAIEVEGVEEGVHVFGEEVVGVGFAVFA